VAWTLPLLNGIDVVRVDNAAVLGTRSRPVERALPVAGREASGRSDCYVIPAPSSCTSLAARFALSAAEVDVFAADSSFQAGGREYPHGSWIVPAGDNRGGERDALQRVSTEFGLDVDGLRSTPEVPRHALDIPRIGVFHTWLYTQDSGWVRYTLDRWSIPYTLINKDDVRDGNLRAYFDVILIPDTGRWLAPKRVVHGIDDAWSPIPYPVGGASRPANAVDSAEDITGGMGFDGLVELERFVTGGGTLITLGSASALVADFGLARHVNRVNPGGFQNPGSVVRARVVAPASPLAAGYEEITSVFRGNCALLDVPERFRDRYVVVQYGTKVPDPDDEEHGGGTDGEDEGGPICLSGMVRGEKHLEGKPAILDVPLGEGRIVMFTFNPLHRFLNLSDFGFAFNAIVHWND
jgi:hypothetical protein